MNEPLPGPDPLSEPDAVQENPSAKFGDIIENAWASLDNPTRRGFFVRRGSRFGRMNAGAYFVVTDGKGKFWELPLRGHKITVERLPLRSLDAQPASESLREDPNPDERQRLDDEAEDRARGDELWFFDMDGKP